MTRQEKKTALEELYQGAENLWTEDMCLAQDFFAVTSEQSGGGKRDPFELPATMNEAFVRLAGHIDGGSYDDWPAEEEE